MMHTDYSNRNLVNRPSKIKIQPDDFCPVDLSQIRNEFQIALVCHQSMESSTLHTCSNCRLDRSASKQNRCFPAVWFCWGKIDKPPAMNSFYMFTAFINRTLQKNTFNASSITQVVLEFSSMLVRVFLVLSLPLETKVAEVDDNCRIIEIVSDEVYRTPPSTRLRS